MYIRFIIYLNGIYDILCAISILLHQQKSIQIKIPVLSELHLKMFNQTPVSERLLAFWIFTYGMIRISNHSLLISYSYYLEAIFFFNEYMNATVDAKKAFFVIVSSLMLGFISSFQ